MDTNENIPGSLETAEITKQSAKIPSSSVKQQGGKFLLLRIVSWLYKWFQVNTFAPAFLSGTWSQPIIGYFVAFVGQLLVVIGLLALFYTYPSFHFSEGPLILVILLVALGWGAGPSVVALLVGTVLLIFFVFPPTFSLSFGQSSDVIELCLYVVVGLTISILASNTERSRRTSEQLRLRLDTIIDAIPDSIVLYDLQGRRIQQNRVAREMGNAENPPLSVEEMPGQLAIRRAGGEPFPFEALPLVRALKGETVIGTELLYRVPVKQRDRLVLVSAAPLHAPSSKTIEGAVTITHDLTEQKVAEEARRQLAAIVLSSSDAIIGKTLDGTIISWNTAAERMYGYTAEEIVGKPITLLFPQDRQDEFSAIMEHIKRGERLDHYETMRVRKDGTILNVAVTVSPIKDVAGEIIGASAIARDISEQKRLQAELWKSKQQLEVILENKDEFISMASHELKTPLTSLKGFTNVLQRRLAQQGDEQILHYLSRMDFQLYKLTKIINDLLDISKMQAGQLSFQKEPFEFDSLIQETVEDLQAATLSHHFLIEGKTGKQILGDKDRLEQVFINLLTNAVKYSPQADKVLVSLLCTQEEAIVGVKDFGIGIDESYHHKIFERFYQVTDPEEKTYPGLGMGLYISKEIVDRHHGRMWVESRKGEGATFFVALPLLQEDDLESPGIDMK